MIPTPCLYALGCCAELSRAVVDVNDRLVTADRMGDETRVARASCRADWLRYIVCALFLKGREMLYIWIRFGNFVAAKRVGCGLGLLNAV